MPTSRLVTLVSLISTSLALVVAGLASYYGSQLAVQAQVAQIREDYVKKDELKETREDIRKVQSKLDQVATDTAVTKETLRNIEHLLRQQGRDRR